MKQQVGNRFPLSSGGRFGGRRDAVRDAIHILILDPIVGSRFSLVQASSQPGYVVDAVATVEDARTQLGRQIYSLIIVDHNIAHGRGLEFLTEVRVSNPDVCRALIATQSGLEFKRNAIEQAALSFLMTKPWSPEALRLTIRELLAGDPELVGWDTTSMSYDRSRPRDERRRDSHFPIGHHEVVLRGLLAGLNSCELENEVFDLVHAELAAAFRVSRWLWVDEGSERATCVAGDWPVEDGIGLDALTDEEVDFLRQARRSLRVTRLDERRPSALRTAQREACLGLALRTSGYLTTTCLIWVDRACATALVSMLCELQVGLQMAFKRIREAESRAAAARDLARRVSEELRTPVGALTHAIDRLRGEAERAGLSTEWVDQVSSQSERVVRAVEHLEGEMSAPPTRSNFSVSRSGV